MGKEVVASIPELRHHPFKDRIVLQFVDAADALNFDSFLQLASVFAPDAAVKDKAACAFAVYGLCHTLNHSRRFIFYGRL